MKNKVIQISVILMLLLTYLTVPVSNVRALTGSCSGGQYCWYYDPAHTTYSGDGLLCSSGAYTAVYSNGLQLSGTNGTVRVELRWSGRCTANWSRGTIVTSNSTTKQLGTKASPSNSGFYTTDYYYSTSGTLPAGTQRYTWMVDGTHLVTAYAGINSTICNGNTDLKGNYSGWPCNYNPLQYYSG